MDDEGFLQGLKANPKDDSLRLIYADWLEERGDSRAEFLRVSVSLRSLLTRDDRFPILLNRLQNLRPTTSAKWLKHAYQDLAEDEIREAVFRQVLGESRELSNVYLRVEGESDPSLYLLARLSKSYTGLKPSSAAVSSNEGVFDKQTGERGCMLSVHQLEWVSTGLCLVDQSCFWDGLGAVGNSFRVGIKRGCFKVIEVVNTWMS